MMQAASNAAFGSDTFIYTLFDWVLRFLIPFVFPHLLFQRWVVFQGSMDSGTLLKLAVYAYGNEEIDYPGVV